LGALDSPKLTCFIAAGRLHCVPLANLDDHAGDQPARRRFAHDAADRSVLRRSDRCGQRHQQVGSRSNRRRHPLSAATYAFRVCCASISLFDPM
jgi:hypothetical protein